MNLYIVRHGKAEDAGAYTRDEDRPLAPKGFEQARYLGNEVGLQAGPPELILSSGYSRAVATARVIHQSVRCRFELAPELECGHAASEVLDLIEQRTAPTNAKGRRMESLMIVGHNPQLGELCTILTHGVAGSEMMLRTGEAVCLSITPGDLIGTGRIRARLRLAESGDAASIRPERVV